MGQPPMVNSSVFVPFNDTGGNRSYVRVSSIAAIYHDGSDTLIVLSGNDGSRVVIKSLDMPESIYRKIRALEREYQPPSTD